jgi:hypothetical protein
MNGARRLTRWMMPSPLTGSISDNSFLVRSEVRRRRWLLPPLVRTSMPDPVMRNRLLVALWVFILNLPSLVDLRGTAKLLSIKSYSRKCLADRHSALLYNKTEILCLVKMSGSLNEPLIHNTQVKSWPSYLQGQSFEDQIVWMPICQLRASFDGFGFCR